MTVLRQVPNNGREEGHGTRHPKVPVLVHSFIDTGTNGTV
jgi:hypothetical protein